MVHKFKNKVENFLFSEMPVDSMDYERKGGCFVTISKGVILTVLFVIFGFILGLLVFFTTKHVYEISSPISLEEFIQQPYETNNNGMVFSITPKHYRILLNPILNNSENPFSFNGNVWITITPSENNVKTIELDVKNLVIHQEDVSVYRSHTLSDLDFQLEAGRDIRSANLMEDDSSTEDSQFDILFTSTQLIDLNDATTELQLETQEIVSETDENNISTSTDFSELHHGSEGTEPTEGTAVIEGTDPTEGTESTETFEASSVTEENLYNTSNTWDGLIKNDTNVFELHPDKQTELKLDDIQLDVKRGKLKMNLSLPLRKGHYYIVKVFFRGKMNSDYGLVYKSYNGTDISDNFIAATITEPDYMPSVFPCFNNFIGKTTFELNLIHHIDYQSVSVSKLIKTETITTNWIMDTYEKTSLIKLNNFGFVITNIEPIIITATSNQLLNSYFRSSILPSITLIDSDIPNIIKNFENYTNTTYPMESISFVGIPNINYNIMEIKHGLVIASEFTFITHDEIDKSNKVADIAHQIGKLWCQPWQNIQFKDQAWIDEALPLQLKSIGIIDGYLNNNYGEEEMVEKRLDSMRNGESLVEFSLVEFSNHRSDNNWIDIARTKGVFLLDIIQQFLTKSTYQMGIQKFFKLQPDGSASLLHSFSNLTRAENIPRSISMEKIIHDWSSLTNYPLISISSPERNSIEIRQSEFGKTISNQFWTVPIPIKEQTIWLQNNSMLIDIEDNWLTLETNGYYRVNYDESHWQTILKALRMDHKMLSTVNRAILIDDAFNLAKNIYLNYSIVVELLKCWNERETDYLPWKTAFDNLKFVYQNSVEFEPASGFNILLKNLTERVYKNIVRSPLGGFSYKLKVLIKKWSCEIFSLSDCVADSKKDFEKLINNGTLKPSQRSSVDIEQLYCTSLRYTDRDYWDLVRYSFDRNISKDYNNALIYSLGCSNDHRTLNEYYHLLFDKRYDDYATAIFRSMSENSIGYKYALEFVFTHFQQLYEIHGLQTIKLLLNSIGTEYDYGMLKVFFSKNSSIFMPKDKKVLIEIVNTIKRTLNWKNRFVELSNT